MKKKITLLFFATIFTCSELFSQNVEDEIIVTSSKLIKNQLLGGSTHIITRDEIQNYPGDSLVKIISRLPGIEFNLHSIK